MRPLFRGASRMSPLLLVTMPAASLILPVPAAAQERTPGVQTQAQTPSPATQPPLTVPAPAGNPAPNLTFAQTAQTANAPKIAQIIVTGNKTLSQTYIILTSGHNVGEPCTDQVLADMQARLYATGYFGQHSANPEDAVRVRSEEPNPPTGECKVIIDVDENETVQNVNLTGSGPLKPEEVRPLLHITQGKVYNEKQFLRDIVDIQELYKNRGYVVTTAQDAGIDEKGILNVSLVVTRVGEIKIVGNHKTRRNVILREMRTKVGDYFNRMVFERDLLRLYNLDLFESVTPADYTLGPGRVGLTLNVPEKRTGTVTAGVGYSNRQQLIGFAEVSETNFRGLGEAVTLRAETGGAAGRSSVELGFNEPYLDRKRTSLNVQLYDKVVYRFSNNLTSNIVTAGTTTTVGNDNRYNEQRTGGTVTVSRPFRDTYRAGLSLRGENVRTSTLDLPPDQLSIIQNGPIVVGGASLIHNTRDLDLDPVSGSLQQYNVQIGSANLKSLPTVFGLQIPGVSGNLTFTKAYGELRQYIPLAGGRRRNKPDEDKSSVAVRLLAGTSSGTLPFFEQFFVGGGDNLRGYRDDRFWGSNLLLGSIELRQPLARKFKGVLFLDVGHAWGGAYQNVNLNGFAQSDFRPRVGVGVGLRVNTPIGPLRLDYGIGEEGGRTHFNIGPSF